MVDILINKLGVVGNKEIFSFTMQNSQISVELTNYGASVLSIRVPDKDGKMTDIVLGYKNLEDYIKSDKFLGATVGRSANRIEDGLVKIGDEIIQLSQNEGSNHIHGGFSGLNKKVWDFKQIDNGIEFSYLSPNGEEGYPGNLQIKVTYTIEDFSLKINYKAQSDKDTVFNPTNHTYFNLDGKGDVLEQYVKINSDYYTENDENSLPNGKICSVEDTPMDFRNFKKIGDDIECDFEQIKFGKGFDNNWVVKDYDSGIKSVAQAYSEESGIKLEVLTDFPGLQFYSGNYLDIEFESRNDIKIDKRCGFCLECQYFPNSFKHDNFLKPIIKAGEIFNKNIIYKFN